MIPADTGQDFSIPCEWALFPLAIAFPGRYPDYVTVLTAGLAIEHVLSA